LEDTEMSAEKPHKLDTGAIFPNSEKWIAEKEGRPQHGGEATIVCQHCQQVNRVRVSAWQHVDRAGKAFMSLAFTAPRAKKEAGK
jgi:hypothetical protein